MNAASPFSLSIRFLVPSVNVLVYVTHKTTQLHSRNNIDAFNTLALLYNVKVNFTGSLTRHMFLPTKKELYKI